MSVSTVLAKALYDNTAESVEELAFRKGDILMVLDQEHTGGPGWWLCSLHGKPGIVPANRLKILQTALPPDSEPSPGPKEESVYLSPGLPLTRTVVRGSTDGVYLSPPVPGGGVVTRTGELRKLEVGRPRSHSSSGTRPKPDWDIGAAGWPRSPSLRVQGSETSGTFYQKPLSPLPSAVVCARQPGVLKALEPVYLSPSGMPRATDEPEDTTYLVPRDKSTAGHSDDCYLVPKGTALASDDVYQSPTGVGVNGTSATPLPKATPSVYQTPTPHRPPATVLAHQHPSPLTPTQASPRPMLRGFPPNSAAARGKSAAASHRGSPLLIRAGQVMVPGSPNFARKPPPPAPPLRGVTRKEAQQTTPSSGASVPKPSAQVNPAVQLQQEDKQIKTPHVSVEKMSNGLDKSSSMQNDAGEKQNNTDVADDQVYDTPPSGRWQQPIQSARIDDVDGIYDTPRSVQSQADPDSEVYDVPTITLNKTMSDIKPNEQEEEDVYSVPTLPGVPLGLAESTSSLTTEDVAHVGLVCFVPGPDKRVSSGDQKRDSAEAECGIYDMPALIVEVLPRSSSLSSSASTRRHSVSSNGSGDVQWKPSLLSLVNSLLGPASTKSSRELAVSLAEILSSWKASLTGDPPPPLQQTWARLSDLLPPLTTVGDAPPTEDLLSLVQCSLEECALLLQAQGRPRLSSQESLSRRPLPALPVPDGKSSGGGMGSRKGSWIQERPLPPTPQPMFPLPPAPACVTVTVGPLNGEDDPSNEYAGIGLTPIPAPVPTGDSVGYVKLQGKPDLPTVFLSENGQTFLGEQRQCSCCVTLPAVRDDLCSTRAQTAAPLG